MSNEQRELLRQAVLDIGEALEYPVDRHGNHYDVRYLIPALAWHLARAGFGRVEGQAVIKPRELPNGVIDWVGIDEPDDPPDPLAGMTLEQLAAGTPQQRELAAARLRPPTQLDDLSDAIPWTVRTHIQVDPEDAA